MLVTSRETRRWIIPKGWPHKGKAPHDSAAREAFEEARVVGAVGKRAVGSFPYQSALRWNQLGRISARSAPPRSPIWKRWTSWSRAHACRRFGDHRLAR